MRRAITRGLLAEMQKGTRATGLSQNTLGLFAIILIVILWAVAANVAHSLFIAGVHPFELAGVSAMISTFGLAILDSFVGRKHAKAMNWQQFVLGLVLVGLVGADYIAIQPRFPRATCRTRTS